MEGRADSETDPYECVLEERAPTEDALHDYLLEGRTERFEGLMLLAEGDLGDKLSVWCAVGGPAASFACESLFTNGDRKVVGATAVISEKFTIGKKFLLVCRVFQAPKMAVMVKRQATATFPTVLSSLVPAHWCLGESFDDDG